MLGSVLAVGIGAAVGAWLRWGLSIMLNAAVPHLPLGTLLSNLIGGFLMGIAMALMAHFEAMSPQLRLLMTTGFLGGLTTFSTFSAESVTLLSRGQLGWGALLIGAHVAGSIACTFAGIFATEMLLRP
jgi:fluoride exporter